MIIVTLVTVEAVPTDIWEPHNWYQPTATTTIGQASVMESTERRIDVSHLVPLITHHDTLSSHPNLISAVHSSDYDLRFPLYWGGRELGLCGSCVECGNSDSFVICASVCVAFTAMRKNCS